MFASHAVRVPVRRGCIARGGHGPHGEEGGGS